MTTDKTKEKLDVDKDKKVDPNFLEEDDEFEEFPAEEWQEGKPHEEEEELDEDVNVWEDNWDDESVEDDFSKQLRNVLEQKQKY